MHALVLIATYNEKENIAALVRKILELPQSFDVLVVDDNSPDGTGKIANDLAAETDRVFVIHRPVKQGLGAALIEGFKWTLEKEYDLVCTMDADHSHAPEYLPGMIETATDAAFVIGSRYIPGGGVKNWPASRKILSKMANIYAHSIMGLKVNDCTGGYRVYSRDFLASVNFDKLSSAGHSFLVELLWEAQSHGWTIKEFPIIFVDRVQGISKITFAEVYRGAKNLLLRRLSGTRNDQ